MRFTLVALMCARTYGLCCSPSGLRSVSSPTFGLVVGGRLPESDTAFAPDPRRIAREIGLAEDAVQFVGFIPEELKPAVYRGARAFVFPSLYEGFGYPPFEALRAGCPSSLAARRASRTAGEAFLRAR